MKRQTRKHRGHKRRIWAAPFGSIVIILAVVGLATAVILLVNQVSAWTSDAPQRKKIEAYLEPVVMLDPKPFDTIEAIDKTMVCDIALRACLLEREDQKEPADNLLTDDLGRTVISYDLVEAKAKFYFGDGVVMTPPLNPGNDSDYEFIALENAFHVPATAQMATYIPVVDSIKKNGGSIIAKVGYISSDAAWARDESDNPVTPPPSKHMQYTLESRNGHYIITAITFIKE